VVIPVAYATNAQGATVDREAVDTVAIDAVWSMLDKAWNQRDVDRFTDLFTEDVDFVFVDRDQRLAGRTKVHERFAVQFPTMAPDLRHVTEIERYRRVAADVVAVDGNVEVYRPDPEDTGQTDTLRRFAIFVLMVQTQGYWRIRDLRIYQLPTESGDTK
jgi:uncharacterized protein (TIGR02246 family)